MIDDGSRRTPGYVWRGRIGCEGGPLLVCEVDAFAVWSGARLTADDELDPTCDLVRATAVLFPDDDEEFDAGLVRFGADESRTGLVWDLDGPGTAEVATAGDDRFVVMRSWVRDAAGPRRHVTGQHLSKAHGRKSPRPAIVDHEPGALIGRHQAIAQPDAPAELEPHLVPRYPEMLARHLQRERRIGALAIAYGREVETRGAVPVEPDVGVT